jgi:mRNA-degrading endonuclease RelE of RelBE toxin-antitoxin system
MELLSSHSFQIDLLMLPARIQQKVRWALGIIGKDPFTGDGLARKCFRAHYTNLYRYRIDRYRIVYCIGNASLKLLAVGRPADIRRRFVPDPTTGVRPPLALAPVHTDTPLVVAARTGEDIASPDGAPAAPDAGKSIRLLADLLARWKLPPRVVRQILACTRVDQLLALDIDDGLKQRVLHWQHPPLSHQIQEEPVYQLPSDADLARYLAGTLRGFLLKLDPAQERVARRHLKGPTLVKGGPGSGKSLVSLYRIRRLMQPDSQRQLFGGTPPRILLVTYTTTLIDVSRQLLDSLLGPLAGNVTVLNLDKLVQRILRRAGRIHRPAGDAARKQAFARALAAVRRSHPEFSNRLDGLLNRVHGDYLFSEFDWVIDGRPVTSLEAYLAEDRAGRGIALGRSVRMAVWELYRRYRALLAEQGLATFDRLRTEALDIVARGDCPDDTRFDEVIVDEAQDLPPAALKLCLKLCRSPERLFITADSDQSIYNRGFSWRRVDDALALKGGRTTLLKYNYRSTRQIVAAAMQPLIDSQDGDGENRRPRAIRQGPRPQLIRCRTETEQIRRTADFLKAAGAELRLPVHAGGCAGTHQQSGPGLCRYKIHPIVMGTKVFDKGMMTYQHDYGTPYTIPHLLLVHRGRRPNVLVDTGEMSPIQSADRESAIGGPIYTFEEGLAKWGLSPRRYRYRYPHAPSQ